MIVQIQIPRPCSQHMTVQSAWISTWAACQAMKFEPWACMTQQHAVTSRYTWPLSLREWETSFTCIILVSKNCYLHAVMHTLVFSLPWTAFTANHATVSERASADGSLQRLIYWSPNGDSPPWGQAHYLKCEILFHLLSLSLQSGLFQYMPSLTGLFLHWVQYLLVFTTF